MQPKVMIVCLHHKASTRLSYAFGGIQMQICQASSMKFYEILYFGSTLRDIEHIIQWHILVDLCSFSAWLLALETLEADERDVYEFFSKNAGKAKPDIACKRQIE